MKKGLQNNKFFFVNNKKYKNIRRLFSLIMKLYMRQNEKKIYKKIIIIICAEKILVRKNAK